MTKKELRNLFYDGFNSKLIETSEVVGEDEYPVLTPPKEIMIPKRLVPFSKRRKATEPGDMIVFYEQDPVFRDFISAPQKYMDELKNVKCISTPDCSIYRDMPLWEQKANIGVSRAVGYYLQQQGKYVIPNVRWGDERTYTSKNGETPVAFLGIPRNSIVSIGTYGCSKKREDKYHLENAISAMIKHLTPTDVIVYGSYNKKIFAKFERCTKFHRFPDWISLQKGSARHGN